MMMMTTHASYRRETGTCNIEAVARHVCARDKTGELARAGHPGTLRRALTFQLRSGGLLRHSVQLRHCTRLGRPHGRSDVAGLGDKGRHRVVQVFERLGAEHAAGAGGPPRVTESGRHPPRAGHIGVGAPRGVRTAPRQQRGEGRDGSRAFSSGI
eukprot:1191974-Prorocentrum_minimum.AAC.1